MGLQIASSWTRTEHALLVVELESERRACHMGRTGPLSDLTALKPPRRVHFFYS